MNILVMNWYGYKMCGSSDTRGWSIGHKTFRDDRAELPSLSEHACKILPTAKYLCHPS